MYSRKSSGKSRINSHSLLNSSFTTLLISILLTIILFAFFIAKIPFLNHYPLWDETVYLGMGKYIYSAGSSGLWEMIRPLGLPLITGAWWSLGLDQMLVSRIIAVLFSLGIIFMTYKICKELFDDKVAIISATMLAITPIFFFYSDYVMTDHVSMLAILLSVYCIMKYKYILGGFFGGLAFWFKFTHILFIGVLILYILYKIIFSSSEFSRLRKKSSNNSSSNNNFSRQRNAKWFIKIMNSKEIYSIIIILFMVGIYFVSNYALYHSHFGFTDSILRPYTDAAAYSNNPYQNTYFSNIKEFAYYISYYVYNIIFNNSYGNILYIFFIIYLFKLKTFFGKKTDGQDKHALLLILFITYLAYFSIIPYKNERFWIFFLPALAIYTAYGIAWTYERIISKSIKSTTNIKIKNKKDTKKITNYKTSSKAIKTIIGAILIIIILAMTGYTIYKDKGFYDWSEHFRKPDLKIERYFDNNVNIKIDGPILTDDPRFAAYSDKRYIPAYDILNKNGLFLNDWEASTDFKAAIYNDKSIPCLEDDQRCITNRQNIINNLNANFTVLDSFYYNGANITFYKRDQK